MQLPKKQIREHYQIVLDSIADGVFTVNLDLCITSFNRSAEKITGIPKEEVIGRQCFEVLRASVCETECLIRQTIKKEMPIVNKPVFILRSDNKRIPIGVTTALLKDSKGMIIGGVETFRDLTVVDKLRKAVSSVKSRLGETKPDYAILFSTVGYDSKPVDFEEFMKKVKNLRRY
ncbi:MAG: PAS domain-containing protein [Proteobacteria bacterium]|nr:PAS domain-containing protein [Pseudomonadota bacterium]MBU4464136.1 PAS domain-containing protein [Pseudomonadota bacterium]